MALVPQIAVIGAGIFVRTQYIPRLREITGCVLVKTIWSRTEESAKAAAELARDFSPNVECKWGDSGLDDIIQDSSIQGVAVVLAGQVQVDISLKMLKAGKHVLQEKPASGSITEAETALSCYNSFRNSIPHQPIWAVAENYRFEPAFVESKKLINDIGDMLNIHVIVEGSMNSSNPYFYSSWRRNFTFVVEGNRRIYIETPTVWDEGRIGRHVVWAVYRFCPNLNKNLDSQVSSVELRLLFGDEGGFILDMGVHFIAGLRMIVGCEISTVSALTRYVDTTLPPPDNICALFQLENGCAGVFVMAVSSTSPKIIWRIDGTKGALQIERGTDRGKHGYVVVLYSADGNCQKTFYPFSGVTEELKCFAHDIVQASNKKMAGHKADPRSSYIEGARDVAVLEAMLESSANQGAPVSVKKF